MIQQKSSIVPHPLWQIGGSVVLAIAVIATVNGKGGFVSADINQSLMQLQSFIGVITPTILVLTATIAERTQAETKLRLAMLLMD
ncbi:MAG: hypothetical protein V7L27_27905 [Nostoc sp.]|uniref:hypothetical protein n=1 Tax=Nostoc sp. TaxID=1180 RepID=UPI002FFBEFD7